MSVSNPVSPRSRRAPAPHIKTTRYDVAVSILLTTATCAGLAFVVMLFIWLSNLIVPPPSKAVTMLPAGDGGFEDGDPDASPDVESPEDAVTDPSLANEETDVTQLEEVIEQVTEVADNAASVVAPNEFTQQQNSGIPGSAEGKGGRPLGSGGPGRGGAKREQRWFVEFAEQGNLDTYAAQLDFFKIELGAMFPDEGRLVYLNSMSSPNPVAREVKTGDSEKRLFMAWQDGSEDRRKADLELFQKAKIDASEAQIMHFYPAETEEMLARRELEYGNKTAQEIRRTYFQVKRTGGGFEFVVTKQLLK
jgi:hypothetical protein